MMYTSVSRSPRGVGVGVADVLVAADRRRQSSR